jgi:hypothetical protein
MAALHRQGIEQSFALTKIPDALNPNGSDTLACAPLESLVIDGGHMRFHGNHAKKTQADCAPKHDAAAVDFVAEIIPTTMRTLKGNMSLSQQPYFDEAEKGNMGEKEERGERGGVQSALSSVCEGADSFQSVPSSVAAEDYFDASDDDSCNDCDVVASRKMEDGISTSMTKRYLSHKQQPEKQQQERPQLRQVTHQRGVHTISAKAAEQLHAYHAIREESPTVPVCMMS